MSKSSVPIRFEDLSEMQIQLLFEEQMFADFEKTAIRYSRWLLEMSDEERKVHHDSLSRIAHAARTTDDHAWDITPDCDCLMCAQWHSAAVGRIWKRVEAVQLRREEERKSPRRPEPTFIYLMLDERSGYIKIGRAKDPAARERTLQSENPHVTMIFRGHADAYLERELHQKYLEFRVRGEWFKLSKTQVEEIILRVGGEM